MRNRVRLGLAVVAVALSTSWAQANTTLVQNPEASPVVPFPDVAKTPSPVAPVPIPYPNMGSPDKEDRAAKKQPVLKNEAGTLKEKKEDAAFKKRNDELKKQLKEKQLADKKKEIDKEIAGKKKDHAPKFEHKKPVEIVKPDVPKPPLRPVDVPHPVKLPQPIHRPIDVPRPVLRPVDLPAKPVLPVKPIEPVKLPQPIKIEQPVKAQPVILQPAPQMPVRR